MSDCGFRFSDNAVQEEVETSDCQVNISFIKEIKKRIQVHC